MRFQTPKSMLLSLSLLSVLPAALLLTPLRAEIACTGHKLLSNPRPESSCSNVKPVSYASPDGCAARCRSSCRCQPLCHSGHGKPRRDSYQQGRHAHVEGLFIAARHQWILRCQSNWSPDSQFFVYSMSSSGGHSPWSFPLMVYSRQKNRIAALSDMIGGKPTVSADFHFSGPHTLVASTWMQPGALEDKVPVIVDLEDAFGKLPPSSD